MGEHLSAANTQSTRKVLVTGGSSGIGLSTVKKFLKEGFLTAYADIKVPLRFLENSHFIKADVSKRDDVQRLYETIISTIGVPDVLVCNAGKGIQETLYEGDPELWLEVFQNNVFGTLRILRAFLPEMKKRGSGDIVVVSSVSANKPYPGGAVYTASKAALDVIAETLRLEVQPEIRVTVIAPGVVDTDFFKNIIHGSQSVQSIGWGAIAPDDIAEVILSAISRPSSIALNNIVVRPAAQPM
jgi:NADP-dependent 3-hydroxy acid dehydrogenase YdfG